MRTAVAILIPICLSIITGACQPSHPDGLLERAMNGKAFVIDLTHTLKPGIPVFPGGVPFEVSPVVGYDRGYYMNKFAMGEHTGTHMDAPSHFVEGEMMVDEIPPHTFIAQIVVIDVTEKVSGNPDYVVTEADIDKWEGRNGPVPKGALVVMRSGWSSRWPSNDEYGNADPAGVLHFPGFSLEAARRVDARNAMGIGVDTFSADPGISTDFAVHKYLLGRQKVIIENLNNLEGLPEHGAVVIVMPLPINKGSGAPVRVLAIVPR